MFAVDEGEVRSGSGCAIAFMSELSLQDKIDKTKAVALMERDFFCALPDGTRKRAYGGHMTRHEGSM